KRERQRQHAIQDEAEQKSGEKEEGRPRDEGRRTGAGLVVDSKAEAITELMLEVAQCFFKIRALGQKAGFITSWGGGAFGFMRSLALLGPLTVPQIAHMRPTSRQRMQRLANELAAEGHLIDIFDAWIHDPNVGLSGVEDLAGRPQHQAGEDRNLVR